MPWFPNDASKGKTTPERKLATHLTTGATTSPSAETTFSNNLEKFRNDADKNRILRMAHRCDNDKPVTRLPSIESHRTFRRRSSMKERKVVSEREVYYLENSSAAGKSRMASRDRTKKYEIKENDSDENVDVAKMSKPVTVKYKHQKANPSIEELWRRSREERLERGYASKTTVTDISDEAKRRDYSNLSSISNISALRRQLFAETGNNLQTLISDRVISSNIVRDNSLSDPTKIIDCLTASAAAPEKDGHIGYRPYLSQENLDERLNEEEFNTCLTNDNTCAAKSPPVVSSDVDTFVNNPNRLPDIRIYWQPQVTFEPEVRKWNPHIGETTRAFVFSYFDSLPLLDRSRDSEDADDRRKLQSSNKTKSKTK